MHFHIAEPSGKRLQICGRPGPGCWRRRDAAFSLIETLMAIGIVSLVLSMAAPLVLYGGKSMAGMANYAELNGRGVNALDQLSRDIRQSVRLSSFSTNRIVLDDGTNGALTFAFTNATLIRMQGGTTKTLLTEVDYGEFAMYQRTTISNSYNQYVATDVAGAKAIVVKWICSRRLFGSKVTTENGQTARIVIRKS